MPLKTRARAVTQHVTTLSAAACFVSRSRQRTVKAFALGRLLALRTLACNRRLGGAQCGRRSVLIARARTAAMLMHNLPCRRECIKRRQPARRLQCDSAAPARHALSPRPRRRHTRRVATTAPACACARLAPRAAANRRCRCDDARERRARGRRVVGGRGELVGDERRHRRVGRRRPAAGGGVALHARTNAQLRQRRHADRVSARVGVFEVSGVACVSAAAKWSDSARGVGSHVQRRG